jgi:sugar phosphate permease
MGQEDSSREPLTQHAPLSDKTLPQPPRSILPPTMVRYRILAGVCVLAVISYILRVGFASAGPSLTKSLGLDDVQWASLASAWLLAYGGFEVPWGLLGDRFGARYLLAVVALGSSLLTGILISVAFMPGVLSVFLLLWGLRFLFGLFQAGVFPSLSRLMADWMPSRERGSAQGAIWMCTRAGGFLAPLIVVPLIGATGAWYWAMLLISLLGLVWFATCWPWFRNRPEDSPAINEAELSLIAEGRRVRVKHSGLPWRQVLACRSVWALCAMYSCGGFAANFFVTLLPTYLSKQRGLSDGTVKWLTSLPMACGMIACVLGGVVSDSIIRRTDNRRWGRRINGTIGALIAGLALMATTQVYATWVLGTLLCLTFFCNDLAMGPAWASCADVGHRYAGTIGGAMNMLGNLAGAGGAALAGWLFRNGHPEIVFVIFGCSFCLGSLCWLAVDVTRPVVDPEEPPVPSVC